MGVDERSSGLGERKIVERKGKRKRKNWKEEGARGEEERV